jgi:hypothetical protein
MNDMNDKQIVGRKKKLSIGLLFLVSVSVLGLVSILIINLFVTSSVKDKIITVDEAALLDSDCILILGAGVWDGGRPSYMLEDRLLQGIELYENGAADRLLMSGDHGRKEYDEVNVMKQFAIDRDINSEHIFMDHAGFSTYESSSVQPFIIILSPEVSGVLRASAASEFSGVPEVSGGCFPASVSAGSVFSCWLPVSNPTSHKPAGAMRFSSRSISDH